MSVRVDDGIVNIAAEVVYVHQVYEPARRMSSLTDSNVELVAQGVGNIGSVLFGGIPASGTIARTVANVKASERYAVYSCRSIISEFVFLDFRP